MASENKLLLALQFWKGDRSQAFRLADFLADLEPTKNEQADLLLVARFDCPHNIDLVKRLSRKFNVWHITSRRRGVGWPVGCNELWLGMMDWVVSMRAGKKIPPYKAVFSFEADNAPLMRGWINHFSHEWDVASEQRNGKLAALGFIHPMGPHINGNALFSLDPAMTNDYMKAANRCPANQGWDYYLAPTLKRLGWGTLPGLLSVWNTKTMPEEEAEKILAGDTRWVHGVKDDSLLQFAMRKLL